MINLFRYKKLAIMMLIILIVSFLLTFIAFWNIILQNPVRNEGWVLIFFSIVFLTGVALFLLTLTLSDQKRFNDYADQILTKEKMPAEEEISEEATGMSQEETLDRAMFCDMSRRLAGEKDLDGLCNSLLKGLCGHIELIQGIMYVREKKGKKFNPFGTYALSGKDPDPFFAGEGLAGQAIADKIPIRINDIPEEYGVMSGLGKSRPSYLVFQPVFTNDSPVALLELGFFKKPDKHSEAVIEIFSSEAGKLLHNFFNRQS